MDLCVCRKARIPLTGISVSLISSLEKRGPWLLFPHLTRHVVSASHVVERQHSLQRRLSVDVESSSWLQNQSQLRWG